MASIANISRLGLNLYRHSGIYYRLFGKGITPNGCWIIAPYLKELKDINVATGNDVYGTAVIEFDVIGTVDSSRSYIKYW